MSKIRITVVKRIVNWDVIQSHMGPESRQAYDFPCPVFSEGQSFLSDPWCGMPEGFCGSAWIDIQSKLQLVQSEGHYPGDWVVPSGAAIACCTDGYRPVVFKIERIEGEDEASMLGA